MRFYMTERRVTFMPFHLTVFMFDRHNIKPGLFFFYFQVEESLELFKNKYDIVIVQDETVDVVNALMRRILENKN